MSLQAQLQQVQAQVRQLQAQVSQAMNTASAASASASKALSASGTSPSIHLISPVALVTGNTTAAIAWTTFQLSSYIPSSATLVLLQAQARRDVSAGGAGYLGMYARANSAGTVRTIHAQNSDDVDTDTEGQTAEFWVECSSTQSVDWSKDNGVFHYTVWLVGYYG
jgi:hypothetical protein